MKIILFFILIPITLLHSQFKFFEMDMAPEDIESSYDYIIGLIVEDDKYTFLANTNCEHNSISCLAFCQIDKAGKVINLKKYSFDLPISSNSNLNFLKNQDGTYTIAANLYKDDYIRYPFLIKLDQNGDSLWTRNYKTGNPLIDNIVGIEAISNGDYFMVSYGFTSTAGDIGIIRVDSSGNLKWVKTAGLTSKYLSSIPTYMKILNNGNILVSFRTVAYPNQGTAGNYFAIFDSSGILKTQHRITKHIGAFPFIYPVTDSTFFYACPTDTFLHGNGTNLIHGVINDKGIKLSEYSFPSPEVRRVSGITKSTDGSFFLFDQRDNWEFGKTAYWISKHSAWGELIWEKSYLEGSRLFAHMPGFLDLEIEKNGSIVAAGAIRDTIKFGFIKQNAYIIRLNEFGCINQDTCPEFFLITFTENNFKNDYLYTKVYPNPTLNSVNFIFSSIDSKEARFQITDILNKVIIDKSIWITKGKYHDSLIGLKPGVYFFKFSTKNQLISTGKIIKS